MTAPRSAVYINTRATAYSTLFSTHETGNISAFKAAILTGDSTAHVPPVLQLNSQPEASEMTSKAIRSAHINTVI